MNDLRHSLLKCVYLWCKDFRNNRHPELQRTARTGQWSSCRNRSDDTGVSHSCTRRNGMWNDAVTRENQSSRYHNTIPMVLCNGGTKFVFPLHLCRAWMFMTFFHFFNFIVLLVNYWFLTFIIWHPKIKFNNIKTVCNM